MTFAETIEENYAHRIYEAWQQRPQGKYWTYLEVLHLAQNFVKVCREQNRDTQEYDLINLLDVTLTYQENLCLIAEQVGQTQEAADKENYAKWFDQEQPAIDQAKLNDKLESKNVQLEQKLKAATENFKIAEAQRLDAEQRLAELKQKQALELSQNFLAPPAPVIVKVPIVYSEAEQAELIEAMDLLAKQKQQTGADMQLDKVYAGALKVCTKIWRGIKWVLI